MKKVKSPLVILTFLLALSFSTTNAQCLSGGFGSQTITNGIKFACPGASFNNTLTIGSGGTLVISAGTYATFTNIQFAGSGNNRGKLIVYGNAEVYGAISGVDPNIIIDAPTGSGLILNGGINNVGNTINNLNLKNGFLLINGDLTLNEVAFGVNSSSIASIDAYNLTINSITCNTSSTIVTSQGTSTFQGAGNIKGCWSAYEYNFIGANPILFDARYLGGFYGEAINLSFNNTVFSTNSSGYLNGGGTCSVSGSISIPSTVQVYSTGGCTLGSATILASPSTGGCY